MAVVIDASLAAYLEAAKRRRATISTLDVKLAAAAVTEGITNRAD